MSCRIEIVADNSDRWVTNGLRFATKEEAEASVFDETKGFYETRFGDRCDPVNSRWVDGKREAVFPCAHEWQRDEHNNNEVCAKYGEERGERPTYRQRENLL